MMTSSPSLRIVFNTTLAAAAAPQLMMTSAPVKSRPESFLREAATA